MEAGLRVKRDGLDNDLLQRIAEDPEFPLEKSDLEELLIPEKYIGRCKEQVEDFIATDIAPLLEKNKELLNLSVEIKL